MAFSTFLNQLFKHCLYQSPCEIVYNHNEIGTTLFSAYFNTFGMTINGIDLSAKHIVDLHTFH